MTLKGTEAKQMISSGDRTLEPNLLRSILGYSSLYLLFGHWTLDFRHWILDVGHWTLKLILLKGMLCSGSLYLLFG